MGSKLYQMLIYTLLLLAVMAFCAPTESESRRVIFYAPRNMQIYTGQILSTSAKVKPCQKCHMRDHRGNCRRVISFNADGVKC